jgi:hypothetical protein
MKRFLSSLFLFTLFLPYPLLAQETAPVPGPSIDSIDPSDIVSCFDYYRFGSVPVTLAAETIQVAQGADLQIQGKVINQNSYRVDDITVYGKIYYKKNFEKSSFGPDIIQMLPLAEDISLEAGEEKTFTYTYPIPPTHKPGNYQVAAFVVSHDRFNMAGLSFTSDVVGSLLNFSVVGEDRGSVYFDNTKTVLNDLSFHSTIFPPRSPVPEGGLPISAVVMNTTDISVQGKIHWKVYSWDNMSAQNLIEESETSVLIEPASSTNVSYRIQDKDSTVYYVLGELMPEGASVPVSVLQIRYIHTGPEALSLPRLGFLGVTQYPAEKEKTEAFVCVHSTGSHAAKNAKVVLTVKELKQENKGLMGLVSSDKEDIISRREYTGPIPGRMSALALPFGEGSNNFSVTAELFNDDVLLDTVTIDYPCLPSDTSDCTPISQESGTRSIFGVPMMIAGGVSAFLVLVVIAAHWLRRRKISRLKG